MGATISLPSMLGKTIKIQHITKTLDGYGTNITISFDSPINIEKTLFIINGGGILQKTMSYHHHIF